MALFAPTPIGNTEGNIHLVEMRAGKMFRQGSWVYPDDRKGAIYIYRNSDDLMHFCWKDRITLMVEDDFIVFPGDCTYSKVKQCTTGRAYVLKFENSNMRMFYWLQEPRTDKDDEHCRRINYLLNHAHVHHTSPSPFNITQAQLSRIFGPEVAAQLSAIMTNEENIKFSSGSNSEDKARPEKKNEHSTTISSEGEASVSNANDPNMANKKRSSLKADTSDDIEKKRKSVTIMEDVQDDKEDSKDSATKKNDKTTPKISVTDERFASDIVDVGSKQNEQNDGNVDEEKGEDGDDDENKD